MLLWHHLSRGLSFWGCFIWFRVMAGESQRLERKCKKSKQPPKTKTSSDPDLQTHNLLPLRTKADWYGKNQLVQMTYCWSRLDTRHQGRSAVGIDAPERVSGLAQGFLLWKLLAVVELELVLLFFSNVGREK